MASHPRRASGCPWNAARRMGGGSCSPSMASSRRSAISSARFARLWGAFGLAYPPSDIPSHGGVQRIEITPQAPVRFERLGQFRGYDWPPVPPCRARGRSGQCRRTLAWAPACIFLFINRTCFLPPASGKREVRNAKPLISPLTRRPFLTGQTSAGSNGTRAITQRSSFPDRFEKGAEGLGFHVFASRPVAPWDLSPSGRFSFVTMSGLRRILSPASAALNQELDTVNGRLCIALELQAPIRILRLLEKRLQLSRQIWPEQELGWFAFKKYRKLQELRIFMSF